MKVLVCVLLAGCLTQDTPDARQTILRECGPAPLQPGLAVEFNAGLVTMSRADYLTLHAYLDAVDTYAACVAP